jgi:hypothetical protein
MNRVGGFFDPAMARLVEVWPTLPEAIRAGILVDELSEFAGQLVRGTWDKHPIASTILPRRGGWAKQLHQGLNSRSWIDLRACISSAAPQEPRKRARKRHELGRAWHIFEKSCFFVSAWVPIPAGTW